MASVSRRIRRKAVVYGPFKDWTMYQVACRALVALRKALGPTYELEITHEPKA